MSTRAKLLCIATAAGTLLASFAPCLGQDFSNEATYNHPFGMMAGQENQPVNSSLRDANGNLTIVNGQFTSSSFSQQSGVQQAGVTGSASAFGSGAGYAGATGYGGATATAVGNSLNVVTVGSGNTVIVDSHQTNNGNQTANVDLNGK